MPDVENGGKILRGCRAMWGSFNKTDWTLIGKNDDNLSIDTNPETESKKNVLGDTVTDNKGYKPSISPNYIADRGGIRSIRHCRRLSTLSPRMREIRPCI